jgi:hypothetical protein
MRPLAAVIALNTHSFRRGSADSHHVAKFGQSASISINAEIRVTGRDASVYAALWLKSTLIESDGKPLEVRIVILVVVGSISIH